MSSFPSSGLSAFHSPVYRVRVASPTSDNDRPGASDGAGSLANTVYPSISESQPVQIRATSSSGYTCVPAEGSTLLGYANTAGTLTDSGANGLHQLGTAFEGSAEIIGHSADAIEVGNLATNVITSPNKGYTLATEGSGAIAGKLCAEGGAELGAETGAEGGFVAGEAIFPLGGGIVGGICGGVIGGGVGFFAGNYACKTAASAAAGAIYDGATGAPSCPEGTVPVWHGGLQTPASDSSNPITPVPMPIATAFASSDSIASASTGPMPMPTPTPAPIAGPAPDESVAGGYGSNNFSFSSNETASQPASYQSSDASFGSDNQCSFDSGSSISGSSMMSGDDGD